MAGQKHSVGGVFAICLLFLATVTNVSDLITAMFKLCLITQGLWILLSG